MIRRFYRSQRDSNFTVVSQAVIAYHKQAVSVVCTISQAGYGGCPVLPTSHYPFMRAKQGTLPSKPSSDS